jgi:two-component system OmpR family sensor kinase
VTLRRRLLLGVLGLVVIGLAIADVATWVSLRSYLYNQVDTELSPALGVAVSELSPQYPIAHGAQAASQAFPFGTVSEVASPGGQELDECFLSSCNVSNVTATLPSLQLPGHLKISPTLPGPMQRFSMTSTTGVAYTVVAQQFGLFSGGSLFVVVAIPLTTVEATLHDLLLVELLVTLGILIALGVAVVAIIRIGLRPLEEMTATADAIAAGELSRRVPYTDQRTEVGQLGSALNSMLFQIETAFQAKELSESRLRRFVADASHELRTPLTSIRGYAELFRRGAARRPDDLATAMRRIEDEATRMGVLVDDLLLLARLDIAAGDARPASPRAAVDLAAVAADAVADLRAIDPDSPVDLDAAPVVVPGDEAELRQVAANLVVNASHHTPPGTRIHVRTGPSPSGNAAILTVSDEGPGMTEEQASHVFERFWRADSARSPGHGGAGLGLAIVSAIVASHGGKVSVETSPGRGTQFRVELPISHRPEAVAGTPEAAITATGSPHAAVPETAAPATAPAAGAAATAGPDKAPAGAPSASPPATPNNASDEDAPAISVP